MGMANAGLPKQLDFWQTITLKITLPGRRKFLPHAEKTTQSNCSAHDAPAPAASSESSPCESIPRVTAATSLCTRGVAVIWVMSDLQVIDREEMVRAWAASEVVVQRIHGRQLHPQEDRPHVHPQVRPPRWYSATRTGEYFSCCRADL